MRIHVLRLTPGADLKAELAAAVTARALPAAFMLSAVGSLSQARLRMPGEAGEAELVRAWAEATEIVSLSGTLSPEGLHLHLCLSRRDATCLGGHLMDGCIVRTTAELVLGEPPGLAFRRPLDVRTGYGELQVRGAAAGSCGPEHADLEEVDHAVGQHDPARGRKDQSTQHAPANPRHVDTSPAQLGAEVSRRFISEP